MKQKLIEFVRRYFIPRQEYDIAIAHRNAIRNHFIQLQEEYLALESKVFSENGYDLSDVQVSIVETSFCDDPPFCWKMQCTVARELAVALRRDVRAELLPYVADKFRRIILKQLQDRWDKK